MKQRPVYSTTFAKAAEWRVQRHHLGRRAPAGAMLAVASRICGLHAQVLSTAELRILLEDFQHQGHVVRDNDASTRHC